MREVSLLFLGAEGRRSSLSNKVPEAQLSYARSWQVAFARERMMWLPLVITKRTTWIDLEVKRPLAEGEAHLGVAI